MGTKSEQRVLRKRVLCSLLTAGVFIVTLPICAYAAEQTLTGTQTVTTALNGNSKADNLTITGFDGSVQSVQSFKKVTIKDGSVITFGSGMNAIADTVTADETTNVTVNGTIQANFGQTINLNGTNTIGTINAVCSQDQPANITVGSNTTKTVVNGGIASGNNAGSINVILGTADSKVTDIVGTQEGNNRIYLNVGSINIIGVQGSSVSTNRIYTQDSTNFTTGGTINIKGTGMTVDVIRKSNTQKIMRKKYAVTACAGSTINLGAEGERLAKLTVSGEEAGLVALNTIGESCVNPIGINVVSDAVNVTSSDGIAVWAVADYNNTAINVPKINIAATDLTATGSQGAVVAQDGIVTIGAADNYANNVTLNAVDGNTGGYATVYVRGYSTDKNAGAVSIYSHNISVNAPTGGEALSGNGGGHGKNDITQTNTGTTLTASPKADSFSLGIKAEHRYGNEHYAVVPYVGMRYLHLGVKDYTNNLGFSYDADAQNMFLLPLGVKFFGESKFNNWTIRPKAQLGYVWTLGNRNTSQTLRYGNASDSFSYDTADSGYFTAGLGIEAQKGSMMYGLSYQHRKGSSTKNNAFMVEARCTF